MQTEDPTHPRNPSAGGRTSITVEVAPDQLAAIDEWIEKDGARFNRSEAVRALVNHALGRTVASRGVRLLPPRLRSLDGSAAPARGRSGQVNDEARPAGHSDPTLLGLEELERTMNIAATDSEREAWWLIVLRTQSSVDGDARAAKADHDAMRRPRQSVSDVYGALNRGHEPDFSGAKRAIFGLQCVLERRTTGFDGHRLR